MVHRRNPIVCGAHFLAHLLGWKRWIITSASSSLLVLWSLRSRPVLRPRMPQRLYPALGAANTLGLRGVFSPGLTRLFNVGSLGNVRRSIQVSMVGDTAGSALRLRVVAHAKVSLTDVTTLRCISGIDLHHSTAVGLNHISSTPVDLTSEPSPVLHRVLNAG